MNKRSWEIFYSDYSGCEKKALELINKEMGELILRDSGVYTFHTLTFKKADNAEISENAVVVGVYDKNEIIQKYIKKEEIPEDGYVVKVCDNPENPSFKLALITALKPREVFYGAVDFVDDYFSAAAPMRSNMLFYNELFENKLPDYYNATAPAIKTRNIFTWGHPIDDYESYIDNAARLKINQLIVWNDYAPINAEDFVSYAHEYGISVIWGFAWGWSRNCNNIDFDRLDELTEEVLKKYEDEYAKANADGIYFQSFTELKNEYIGDRLIAEVVTDFVNKTAGRLFEKHPNLLLQFGLHATSVKERLQFIKNVDSRIDIIWEDCGEFPYAYDPTLMNLKEYENTKKFTDEILNLRTESNDGVLYKGHLTLDWFEDYFAHQKGPYIIGKSSKRTIENDTRIIKTLWKKYQNAWLANGKYAYDMTKLIEETGNGKNSVGIVGQLTNGIWFPAALLSQIMWECDKKSYEEILEKVLKRRSVELV